MGRDKRWIDVDGEPMLERVLSRLGAAPILLVIDPARPLLSAVVAHNVRLVHDCRPGEGPLAAAEAGLAEADHDIVLMVAADMPWLQPAILDLLVERLVENPQIDLVCLTLDGRLQPFPMGCRRAPTLAHASALLDRGERRFRSILDGPLVMAIDEAEWRRLDPDGRSLRDIDTPADLVTTR
jgi:molybdopterin-guanine dinucleotide biosynthesis protein A